MLVCDKSNIFIGAKVRLNDGRLAEVNEDTPMHDMVVVVIDGVNETVYVGEALEGDTWIKEILAGQSEDPAPEPVEPVDPLDEIFDGLDPDTFDGDILDIV